MESASCVEELAKGHEYASRLQQLFLSSSTTCKTEADIADGSVSSLSVEDLTDRVFKSFSNTLSILNISQSHDDDSLTPKGNNKRKCYKRRRNSHARYVDSPSWIHDGHAWRKYGQKLIHNSKYSRHYFRCTHKNEQGCQATKQVQKIQEDPHLHRTTYFGHHTCKNLQNDSQLIIEDLIADQEDDHNSMSKTVINFGTASNSNKQGDISFSSSLIKNEHRLQNYEETSRYVIKNQQSPVSNHLVLPTVPAADHGNIFSAVNSSASTQIPRTLSRLDSFELFDYIFEGTSHDQIWCSQW